VLYSSPNNTRSRCPLQLEPSGASSTAATSSRDRNVSAGRLNRFSGIARTRWAIGSETGSRDDTYRMNGRIAANRTLRVRALLPRPFSRWSRNAVIVGASRSLTATRAGGVLRTRWR
jgi:hypothetical protein